MFRSSLYVPQRLNASIVDADIYEGTNDKPIGRHNTKLSFEVDDRNTNQVALYALWTGSMAGVSAQQTSPGTRVQNALLVPETGLTTIPSSLFNGMPEGAVLSLFVIRGDVKIENVGQLLFRLAAIEETKLVVALTD